MADYYKAFINLAHLVEDSEKNIIRLFMSGLKEALDEGEDGHALDHGCSL